MAASSAVTFALRRFLLVFANFQYFELSSHDDFYSIFIILIIISKIIPTQHLSYFDIVKVHTEDFRRLDEQVN